MARIIIVWGLWGPYHCRRLAALRQQGAKNGHEVIGLSLFSGSRVNQWRKENLPDGVVHVDLGQDETRLPVRHIGSLLSLPRRFRADVALLPAYGHWSLMLNAGVRMAGGRVVMMNETHAGTVQARGMKAWFKQQVVTRFHAGFVGGEPQRRYFASLGLPTEKIYTGYDAVDNDYFAKRVDEVRSQGSEFRHQYDLPEHYFLSLGRFVFKKNLAILIRAYRKFLDANPQTKTHLVLVGSGEEEPRLRALCAELKLPTYDHRGASSTIGNSGSKSDSPQVHFYGFRQIDENPVFYALADAFVLPSLYEEWGLVVNEAMASGLPVAVSETAGCAEDLLEMISDDDANYSSPSEPANLPKKIRRNGFVFDPRSSDELCGVFTCLNSHPEMRRAMGAASRQIIGKFSCENFAANALAAARASLG
jgi:glycosyltransferase involved in cell wall biosynthesis